jgi:prevent-host-death family protein
VKEVTVSQFKAKCAYILEQVRQTREPVHITRFGKTIAEVFPISPKKRKRRTTWLGCLVGTARIAGDIGGATADQSDREAAR